MTIAVYAGTFDPITNGHLDIAHRAAYMFDELVIAVAENNYKSNLFTTEERVSLVKQATQKLTNVRVDSFSGLLVDYCINNNIKAIVRGLRVAGDFEKELSMALMNRKMQHSVDTVFLISEPEFLFVSSSLIKEVAQVGGRVTDLVPPAVFKALKEKYIRQGYMGWE